MAVPACFISIPHAKREDDDFRIQDEDGHGQALPRPFLLVDYHFLSSECVIELLSTSTISKGPIRKSLLCTRFTQDQSIAFICLQKTYAYNHGVQS